MPFRSLALSETAVICTFLAAAAAITAVIKFGSLAEAAAFGGFGVEHFVWASSPAWAETRDFPTSVLSYGVSFVMRTYALANEFLGIEPTTLAHVHVAFQALLFAVGAYALGNALSGAQRSAGVMFVGVALVSHLPGANLGSFGQGIQSSLHPLYYGYANAFAMLGLAAFINKRHTWAALAMMLAGLSHVVLGLWLAVFLGCGLLVELFRTKDWRIIAPYLLAGLVVSVWALPQIMEMRTKVEPIPFEDFLRASRTFSSHWHPIHLEMFSRRFYQELAPILFSLVILFVSWPALKRLRSIEAGQRVVSGVIGLSILSILGVLFSDVWPNQTAIEICLQRSSYVVTVVAAATACVFLWDTVRRATTAEAAIATMALAALAAPSNGMAIAPWIGLVLYQACRYGRIGPFQAIRIGQHAITLIAAVTTLALVLLTWRMPASVLFGNATLLEILLPIVGIALVGSLARRRDTMGSPLAPALLATLCIAMLTIVFQGRIAEQERRHGKSFKTYASAAYEAQLWARENTAPNALFMVDPELSYGWRDYSQRASFGSHREWGYFGFLYYSGGKAQYEEGLRRFSLFGVDPIAIANEFEHRGKPLRLAGKEIRKRVRRAYNGRSLDDLFEIARAEQIDYVVVYTRRYRGRKIPFEPIYVNKEVEIYAVPPKQIGFYVLIGQSNISGRGELAALPPDISNWSNQQVWVVGAQNSLRRGRIPVDDPAFEKEGPLRDSPKTIGVGLGLTFARQIFETARQPVGLVSCARGGSSIDHWLPGILEHTLYQACLKRLRTALTRGSIEGVIFYQGEGDTKSALLAEEWSDKLTLIIATLRRELNHAELPVVVVAIGDISDERRSTRDHGYVAWTRLQDIQKAYSGRLVGIVSAAGLPLKADGIHLTTESQLELGRKVATSMQSIQATKR